MAKNKISEYSSTAANNTDVANINIAEGCSPSNINNAIRAVMSHLKNFQDGSSADPLTIAGTLTSSSTLAVTGGLTLDGSAGTSGQVLLSAGSGNTPTWGNAFVAGMIMMWSGTIATIPSGWYLCDGTNSTPDLRNRFIIGANADDSGVAKTSITGSATQSGGSKDLITPAHTHTGTASVSERYLEQVRYVRQPPGPSEVTGTLDVTMTNDGNFTTLYNTGRDDGGGRGMAFKTNVRNATGSFTTDSTGSTATNANLPPYYALAFIMKG
jgi:hypothetical protein